MSLIGLEQVRYTVNILKNVNYLISFCCLNHSVDIAPREQLLGKYEH